LDNTPFNPVMTGNPENFVPDSILIIYASASIRNNQMTAMIANHIFFASFFYYFSTNLLLFSSK